MRLLPGEWKGEVGGRPATFIFYTRGARICAYVLFLDVKEASEIDRQVSRVDCDLDMIERGGFAHVMLKEIFEQPMSVQNTMRGRLLAEEGTA